MKRLILALFFTTSAFAQSQLGGGGASSANPSSAGLIDPTSYGVKADGIILADATTTNLSNVVSSASQTCNSATDGGKRMIIVNSTTNAYAIGSTPFMSYVSQSTPCNGSGWVLVTTLGGSTAANANQSIAGTGDWAMGTDNNTAANLQLRTAWIASWSNNANKGFAMPCGVILASMPPFIYPNNTNNNALATRQTLFGCQGSNATVFVADPNWPGNAQNNDIFYVNVKNTTAIGINKPGLGGQYGFGRMTVTSICGNLPGTGGNTYYFVDTFGFVDDFETQCLGNNGQGTWNVIVNNSGEGRTSNSNFQNFTGTWNSIIGSGGQGQNSVTNSIFAFPTSGSTWPAFACGGSGDNGGANCSFINNYVSSWGSSALQSTTNGNIWAIIGNVVTAGGGFFDDKNFSSTIWAFGNYVHTVGGSVPAYNLQNAGSILDISGSFTTTVTAGFNIKGIGIVNDRAGNKWSDTSFSQFTGPLNFVGGGSMVNTPVPVNTNLGVAIGSTALVSNVPYTTPMSLYVDLRQVTAGVGCSAGSNTAQATINYTLPGGTAGSQTSNTLTVSANGAVDTDAGVKIISFTAKAGTAINYTVASTLASTGCSTVPQYAVDLKSGTS